MGQRSWSHSSCDHHCSFFGFRCSGAIEKSKGSLENQLGSIVRNACNKETVAWRDSTDCDCCCSRWPFVEFFCAKVVGATSSEGFLVTEDFRRLCQVFYRAMHMQSDCIARTAVQRDSSVCLSIFHIGALYRNDRVHHEAIHKESQGNRRYQTSPALCNPTIPSQPIGRIACARKFSEYYLLAIEWSLSKRMHWQSSLKPSLQRRLSMLLNNNNNNNTHIYIPP